MSCHLLTPQGVCLNPRETNTQPHPQSHLSALQEYSTTAAPCNLGKQKVERLTCRGPDETLPGYLKRGHHASSRGPGRVVGLLIECGLTTAPPASQPASAALQLVAGWARQCTGTAAQDFAKSSITRCLNKMDRRSTVSSTYSQPSAPTLQLLQSTGNSCTPKSHTRYSSLCCSRTARSRRCLRGYLATPTTTPTQKGAASAAANKAGVISCCSKISCSRDRAPHALTTYLVGEQPPPCGREAASVRRCKQSMHEQRSWCPNDTSAAYTRRHGYPSAQQEAAGGKWRA
jgi:hypothetical protein